MPLVRLLCLIAAIAAAGPAAAEKAPLRVLASIKPVHSIVASVMAGAGTPELLLQGGASPHSYALKPSDARKLSQAQVIFWVGPVLENFLITPLKNLSPHARVVALAEAPGVIRLPARKGGLWDSDPDEQGATDGHVWLDPRNATAMARAAARSLAAADPANATLYARNAEAFAARMTVLDRALAKRLAPLTGRPYIVFHDAYHYFDARYRLSPAGAVTVAADRPAGVRRIEEIHARIRAMHAICVFSVPQFPPRLVAALTEGTGAHTGVLDDLGADIPAGPGLYETLLDNIAAAFISCLGPRGGAP